ncbi:LysR family transcriptional regulator [Burkholderia plantarii]|uniref:LysR family transcriptional regulator n=1 Tax=Burkholderia plantarii TaxID=41899 RepID=UPI0007063679|nr:LysR family transcriptional regulator [Burkholderia plantarii]ALK31848.1 LysR family transcriptional regulator [Burkholderia plantarii]GLZ21939.1 LysR family transcriptional regulator [Burkholderia plantarii]
MKLELRHLRCVLAVAEHLHFARAAEALGIAPPSLTKQIQEAERLLQLRLFHRSRRSVELTAAGAAYVPEAATALAALARAHELGQRAERGELGRIRIGYVGSAAFTGVMQQAVIGFRARRPQVDVQLAELPMDAIPAMLDDGRLDLAYVRPPVSCPDGIRSVRVHADEFVVALPAASPLAALPAIAARQLRDAAFTLPEQQGGTFEVARRGRFTPAIESRPGTLAAVLARVSLGDTVAVVPGAVCDCIRLPGVVYRPLAGKPVRSEIALLFRHHERSQAVRAFLRHAAGDEVPVPAGKDAARTRTSAPAPGRRIG